MTTCPRCGANNNAERGACWDCFAPLTGALAVKVKPMTLVGNKGITQQPIPPAETGEEPAAAPAKKRGLFGKK